jgi:hypothetical protein
VSSTGITITDARLALEAMLDTAGLPVMAHAGQLQAAPGCMVAAADPWLVPIPNLASLERMSRWRIILVAGMVDVEGILDQLGTMIPQVLQAMAEHRIPSDRVPVPGPRRLQGEGTQYLTTELVALIPVDLSTMPTPTAPTVEE